MKRIVTIVEVIVLGCFGVFLLLLFVNESAKPTRAATGATSSGASGASGASEAPAVSAAGQELYDNRCAGCHGAEGQGSIGPALGNGEATKNFPNAADEVKVIVTGRGGMPSFGSRLSAEEIRAIVDYTRNGL